MFKLRKTTKSHECQKRKCVCADVQDLTNLLSELKCQRDRAKRAKKAFAECEFRLDEGASDEMDEKTREVLAAKLKAQRGSVRDLMKRIWKMNDEIVRQEVDVCQTDREIADLQKEIYTVKEKLENCKCNKTNGRKNDKDKFDEAAWREAVTQETKERNRLQKLIKKVADCFEQEKVDNKLKAEQRLEERKADTKLLLCAIDRVERCLNDSRTLLPTQSN